MVERESVIKIKCGTKKFGKDINKTTHLKFVLKKKNKFKTNGVFKKLKINV